MRDAALFGTYNYPLIARITLIQKEIRVIRVIRVIRGLVKFVDPYRLQ